MALPNKMPMVVAAALLSGGVTWSLWSIVHSTGRDQPVKTMSSVPDLRTAVVGIRPDALDGSTVSEPGTWEESLAVALKIPNRKRKLSEVLRLLQEWALCDSPTAFEWACRQSGTLRRTALVAVLTSVAGRPAAERQLGLMLQAENPQEADELGLAVVQTLTSAGHFEAALQFAGGINTDAGADLLRPIFRVWGTKDPGNALLALQTLDPSWHDAAFQSLVNGWAVLSTRCGGGRLRSFSTRR